jgi:hypothetical protein
MGVEVAALDVALVAREPFLFRALASGVAVVVAVVAVSVGVEGSGELRGSDCDSSPEVSSGTSCSLSLRFAIVSKFDFE